MKAILTLLMLILISSSLQAQVRDTSAALKKVPPAASRGVTDVQPQGVEPASDVEARGARSRMDRFIDEDGDGICDHRTSGLGFRRHMRTQAGQADARKEMKEPAGKKQRRGGVR